MLDDLGFMAVSLHHLIEMIFAYAALLAVVWFGCLHTKETKVYFLFNLPVLFGAGVTSLPALEDEHKPSILGLQCIECNVMLGCERGEVSYH
jgi:hypothetical protein